ncbi:hypothetical protein SAMN06265348_103421 [Pedobacter westerhofensis]|uniref:DUF4834 domain-containing protein n=1 Tax=Pedobacter westerhofensis TaxID=425512 RepID=A0A521CDM8_9SPHI|nr:DUF4834 family protein [Pedobacter westerhofensis]SMO56891.1 hypothetical protein SAMN06265348_103421 [Pedobacter westerhofensis]
MGLIKFLFITIMILWVIRLLLRLVFPMVLKSVFGKMQEQQAAQNNPNSSTKPEGSISIDYVPPQQKQGNADKLGDFVEYEEVK